MKINGVEVEDSKEKKESEDTKEKEVVTGIIESVLDFIVDVILD